MSLYVEPHAVGHTKTSMSNITRDLLYVPLFKERAENLQESPWYHRTSSPGTGRTQLILAHVVEEYL